VAEIVGFVPDTLVARQVVRLGVGVFSRGKLARWFLSDVMLRCSCADVSPHARRESRVTRPKLEHAVLLFVHHNGPLGLHCCQLRDIAI
jgi:hypothetical protein